MALVDRICHGRRIAAVLVVAGLALVGSTSAASDEPATTTGASFGPRVLPALKAGVQSARSTRPAPPDTSEGGLLLDRGVFRRLPDVPGALETVHLRNNNRGEVAGTYVEDSDGTPRIRGFVLDHGRVTRIDVPGALITAPLGINDHGQVVRSYFEPDATIDPVTGEYTPPTGSGPSVLR